MRDKNAMYLFLGMMTIFFFPSCNGNGEGEEDADAGDADAADPGADEGPDALPDPSEDPAPDDAPPADPPVDETPADLPVDMTVTEIPVTYVVVDAEGPNDIWQKCTGDLSGDGRVDLIAGGRSGGGLVWYENPDWTEHSVAAGGEHSTDCETADVDGDGDLDVVSLTTSEIRWYENPDWTVHTMESRGLHDVEVADFDGDGDVDAVARNQSAFGGDGNVLHFYRQDTPTSWTHRAVSCGHGEGLAALDVDADGDADVVINSSWFENSGDIIDGTWTEHVFTDTWTHESAFVASADFNGDGRTDIVLSPSELAGETYSIAWFEAPADPTSGGWAEHTVEGGVEAVHHFVGAADFDGNGLPDIASAEMEQGDDPDEVKLFLNEGGGLSWLKQVIGEGGSHSMRIVDVDGDGDMDLFGANWQGSEVGLWVNGTR